MLLKIYTLDLINWAPSESRTNTYLYPFSNNEAKKQFIPKYKKNKPVKTINDVKILLIHISF